jgi:hypothetical protein
MNRFRNYILPAAGLTMLVTSLAITNARTDKMNGVHSALATAIQDVKIVNSTAEAVPVVPQGTTAITGNVKIVNRTAEAMPVIAQGTTAIAGNVNVANAPAQFFQLNTRYTLYIAEGNGTAQAICTVQDVRSYWIKCNGQVRRGTAPAQLFNSWLNVNFIITAN